MKNEILKLLKGSKKALSFEDIANSLYLSSKEELTNLNKELDSLLSNYDVYKTSGDKFQHIDNSPYKKGTYRLSKDGVGRIVTKEKTYNINDDSENEAIDGDTVLFETVSGGKKNEAKVLMVTNRQVNLVIGEVENVNDEAFLKINNFKLDKLNIKLNDASLVTGTKVIAEIKPTGYANEYIGTVVDNIGYKDAPFADIVEICFNHDFIVKFPEEVMDQVDKMPTTIQDYELEGRLDLRNVDDIFTIDGKDTKDMDDAISIIKLPNGNDLVGVHIAHIAHYIKEGTPLDKEAYLRGTSGYFANTVVPELPQKISNGIGSLNPKVDRLTKSYFIEVDPNGKIVDGFITPSIIRSRGKLNYDDVNATLKANTKEEIEKLPEIYQRLEKVLKYMNEVSKTQIKKRDRRGALDMDSRELKIYCDENGKPEIFKARRSEDGERLIESFMLLASEMFCDKIDELGAPCMYRIHEQPSQENLDSFMEFYKALGYTYNKEVVPNSKSVQALLKDIQTRPERDILQYKLLRHLKKAEYSPDNLGHSGLAMVRHGQVTSPIRRYGDLVNDRISDEYICSGTKFEEEKKKWDEKLSPVYPWIKFIPGPVKKEPTPKRTRELESVLVETGIKISKREKDEIACEADVNRMESAKFMEDRIGELYSGTIVDVSKDFLTVQLDNLIEGNLPLKNLPGDYKVNRSHFAVEDYDTGSAFRIGDRLEVQTAYANKETQLIEFAYGRTLSKVNGYMVDQPEKMNKGKRKELKRKYGQ